MSAASASAPLPRSLLWFRQDLRLADNPALHSALKRGAVIPVYIESFDEDGAWAPGAAARWWLHQSLQALSASLAEAGVPLILRRGPALATLRALLHESGADAVYWNRRYEPATLARDRAVKEALRADGLLAESCNGGLLTEPWEIRTRGGTPFQVFTPFMRQLVKQIAPAAPLPAPERWHAVEHWPTSLALDTLRLMPRVKWYEGMAETWQVGEAAARRRLEVFTDAALARYEAQRDRPDLAGTSRLSPHLHWGEISPRQIWHALPEPGRRTSKFMSEVIWREFAHHLLFHSPRTVDQPLRSEWNAFQWRDDDAALEAWQQGRTGFPLVDAGMRELWHTGWMHNRARMIAASFLVKNLRVPWQTGSRWFWDTLVDADLANNTLGWQWVAGCGADASPWFRIFNPVTQAEKFDPDRKYIERWAPVTRDPIVDLKVTREAALDAYSAMRGK